MALVLFRNWSRTTDRHNSRAAVHPPAGRLRARGRVGTAGKGISCLLVRETAHLVHWTVLGTGVQSHAPGSNRARTGSLPNAPRTTGCQTVRQSAAPDRGRGIFYTFLFLKEEGMVYWTNYVDC